MKHKTNVLPLTGKGKRMISPIRLLPLLAALALLSCDDRFAGLEKDAPPVTVLPKIYLKANPLLKALTDSVKIGYVEYGAKNVYPPYELRIDSKAYGSSSVTITELGERDVKINGSPLASFQKVDFVDSTHFEFKIRPDTIGSYDISFVVTDSKSNKDNASVKLTAFDNLLPVATFTVSYADGKDKHRFKFDASKSYDRDAKFGGKVISYSWLIDGQFPTNTDPELLMTLQNGIYIIGLSVTDNDYGISKLYSIMLVVNENSFTF